MTDERYAALLDRMPEPMRLRALAVHGAMPVMDDPLQGAVDLVEVAHWIATSEWLGRSECHRAHVDEIVDAEILPMEPTEVVEGVHRWRVNHWCVAATDSGVVALYPGDVTRTVPDPVGLIHALDAARLFVNERVTP